MEDSTRQLWAKQDRHEGDRARLFSAVAGAVGGERALYPGSFVDVAASMAWPSVVYVDMDRRARRFFEDRDGVRDIVGRDVSFEFHHGDYRDDLALAIESFDVLISLYAGFVSEACTRYLRIGGALLVNPSHGDAAMASIDDRYRLVGVVTARGGNYRVRTSDLDSYLVPKTDIDVTVELLHERGRGIAYTMSPFAYLFERIA
jgi:hypothetical protein